MSKRKPNEDDVRQLPTEGFVKIEVVLNVIAISRTKLYQGILKGIYPAPVKLGARSSAWRVEDIRQLISNLSAGKVDFS